MTKQLGIAINIDRCINCWACVAMCRQENDIPLGELWNRVVRMRRGSIPDVVVRFVPMLCQHCAQPSCRDACPHGAIQKREDGIVLIDKDLCAGCVKLCSRACPYNAIAFNKELRIAEKCTLCSHRVERGQEPACVVACMTRALTFGDIGNRRSRVSRLIAQRKGFPLLPHKNTQPSHRYLESFKKAGEWIMREIAP